MSLRIALISPKGPLYRHRGGIFRRSLRYAPLTLPTLVSLIPEELEPEVTLFDEGIEEIPATLDADLVAMTVITGNAVRAYELADRYRARGIPVVLGGPHITLVPDDAAPHADAIVTGYAEESWPELLRDFAAGRMRARYEQAPDLSLAGRPFVDRKLMKRSGYVTTSTFEATRGCVHSCSFCVVPSAWGTRPYRKPIEEVVEEIRRTGTRRALFLDLNLIADRDYAARLFEALVPLRLKWFGLSTVLLAQDAELLELCRRSGGKGVLIGFESIAREGMREVRKGFSDPGDHAAAIRAFHRAGIAIQGTFVLGLDHDTKESFRRTAEFAVEHKIDLPRFTVLTPFPGTPLHDRLEGEGRILTRNWELYDGQHVVYTPARTTVAELEQGLLDAWRIPYTVPAIFRRIRRSPAPLFVRLGVNLGYRLYGKRLPEAGSTARALLAEQHNREKVS